MTTNYPLTIEEFKEWLKSKNWNEIVGEIGYSDCCPLANSLKVKTQKDRPIKLTENITIIGDWFTLYNPLWVEKFVSKVDSIANTGCYVIAKRALNILEKVEKECDILSQS